MCGHRISLQFVHIELALQNNSISGAKMFAKLKKKIEETDGPANRSFGSPGPGVASPVRKETPTGE